MFFGEQKILFMRTSEGAWININHIRCIVRSGDGKSCVYWSGDSYVCDERSPDEIMDWLCEMCDGKVTTKKGEA